MNNNQLENPFSYTPVHAEFSPPKISARATLVSIGSCFADHIVGRLFADGFRGAANPNGILYHPFAISAALERLEVGYFNSDFFEFNNLWHSWMHHGSFSAVRREDALLSAENARKSFLKALKKADACFLTLSSAVQYYHIPSQQFVANCHKVPNNNFERRLSSTEQCTAALLSSCRKIHEINPLCRIVLTLSPIRNYPGELTLNAVSKARLLDSIAQTLDLEKNIAYFPAYEIMLDELRDYRFYASDLLHPSVEAENILFERLLDTCFEPDAKSRCVAAEEKRKRAAHIPVHPDINPKE